MTGALKIRTAAAPDVWTVVAGTTTPQDLLWVGPNAPTDPATELWWDTDEPTYVVNVRNFGAVGDGIVDDSAAIQAAIDFCVGGTPTAGVSTVRYAKANLYFPKGYYRINTAPRIISVMGLEIYGDGYTSMFYYSGSRTYGIEFQGISRCYIHDLRFSAISPNDDVRDVIALNWDPAIALRSTTLNTFERIYIENCKYVNAFAFGLDTANRQVDQLSVIDCVAQGQWTPGETTWWQTGFLSGSGTAANILNHNYLNCDSVSHRYNLFNYATNVTWQGGNVGHGEVDFRHNGARSLGVAGLRSESSQRLLLVDSGASYSTMVTLSDIIFNADSIHTDKRFIQLGLAGLYTFHNIEVQTEANPRFHINHGQSRPCEVIVDGMKTQAAITDLFTSAGATSPVSLLIRGYTQTTASFQALTEWPLWNKSLLGTTVVALDGIEGTAPSLTGKTGEYWGVPVTKGTVAMLTGTLYTFSVFVPYTVTIDRIGAEVTTLSAGSTITLGIYDDNGVGFANNLVLDAGTIDGGTVSAQEKTISQVLQGGKIYHLAALIQGTPTMRSITGGWVGFNSSLINALGSGTLRSGRNRGSVVGTTLPSLAGSMGVAIVPSIAVRFA